MKNKSVKINGGLRAAFDNSLAFNPKAYHIQRRARLPDCNTFTKALAKTIVKGGSFKIRKNNVTIDKEIVYE